MANIKINDVPQRIQYEATNPNQAIFPIPFPFLLNTDIVVWQDEVLLSPGGAPGQYGLLGAGTASGGSMTLVTPAIAGTIITIIGSTPIDRTSIYSPTISNLTGDDLNSDLNRIIIMLQELWTIQNFMMLQYKPWLQLSQDINVTKDRWLPILPPLHGWMMNASNNEIIAAPFGGGGGGGGGNQTVIVVTTPLPHGFVADQAIYHDGIKYELALADDPISAEVVGMVISVIDPNNFVLLTGGEFTTAIQVLVPGVYFLSDIVPGLITLDEPTTPGHISKPLVIATDTNTGVFYNMRGKIVNVATFPWLPVDADTVMQPNTYYYTTGGGNLFLTLPVVAPEGSVIKVAGYGSLGWRIAQNAGQSISIGITTSTVGVAGYIESTEPTDCVDLLCVVADTHWIALSTVGNINVV